MKKLLALLLVVATLFCIAACGGNGDEGATTTTTTTATTTTSNDGGKPDPANEANWDKVINNVYTSSNGGLQMQVDGWKSFTTYPSINMVPVDYNNEGNCNAICVAVYDRDDDAVFAAKTKADFEAVLKSGEITTFESIEVCGNPAYYAVIPDFMYVYVINTATHKYFINFMHAPDKDPMEQAAKDMMATIEIFK